MSKFQSVDELKEFLLTLEDSKTYTIKEKEGTSKAFYLLPPTDTLSFMEDKDTFVIADDKSALKDPTKLAIAKQFFRYSELRAKDSGEWENISDNPIVEDWLLTITKQRQLILPKEAWRNLYHRLAAEYCDPEHIGGLMQFLEKSSLSPSGFFVANNSPAPSLKIASKLSGRGIV